MGVNLPLEMNVSASFVVIALIAILAMAFVIFVALFDPGLRYKISAPRAEQLDSEDFLYMLEALTDAKINHRTALHVLTNGDQFYEAELQVITAATKTINLEAYIFQKGEIAGRCLDAIAGCARAGVKVNLLLDAVGSAGGTDNDLQTLRNACGCVGLVQPGEVEQTATFVRLPMPFLQRIDMTFHNRFAQCLVFNPVDLRY